MKRVYLKAALVFIAVAVVFTGLMGFAHTKVGRPLLVLIGPMMSSMSRFTGSKQFCPLGYDRQASGEERVEIRAREASRAARLPLAKSLEVLSFELGRTTRDQISSWAVQSGGECHAQKSKFEIECVGPFYGAQTTTLWLEFDAGNRLVTARGLEDFKSAEQAWKLFDEVRDRLRKQSQRAIKEDGALAPAGLKPLLAQSSVTAGFKNMSATARVGNMGSSFVVSHEFKTF